MKIFDERLEKCPMCNGDCYYEENNSMDKMITVHVRCAKCGLSGYKNFLSGAENPIKKTIVYWNTRVAI